MTDEIIFAVSLAAGYHAYSFGKWLRRNGNTTGAYVAFALALGGIGFSGYRLFTSQ